MANTEPEEEFDDHDYTPNFIQRLLNRPPVSAEDHDEFVATFESFEMTHAGRAKTAAEHLMVYQATVLTYQVMSYQRIRVALTQMSIQMSIAPHSNRCLGKLMRGLNGGATLALRIEAIPA